MRIVKYGCGCIGLRDSTTTDTIILQKCDRGSAPHDSVIFAAMPNYIKDVFTPLSMEEEARWIHRVAVLILDGHRLRDVQRIMHDVRRVGPCPELTTTEGHHDA